MNKRQNAATNQWFIIYLAILLVLILLVPPSVLNFHVPKPLNPADALEPNINITTLSVLTGPSITPKIATIGDSKVFIAWQEPTLAAIFVVSSTNGGVSFSSAAKVPSVDEGSPDSVQVATSGADTLHLVWQSRLSGNIFYSSRTSSNATFSTPEQVSSSGFATNPQIAVSPADGVVHLVWVDNQEIFYANNQNGGKFGRPTNISNTPASDSKNPQIAISSTGIYVTWEDSTASGGILLSLSTNGGRTFSDSPIIISATPSPTASRPKIALSADGKIYIAWLEASKILLKSSSGGSSPTFSGPVQISTGAATNPRMALSADGKVHLIWMDISTAGNSEIFYANGTGTTFNTPKNVSATVGPSEIPRIAVFGTDQVYVVWQDGNTGLAGVARDILLTSSKDGGKNFDFRINVSNNLGSSINAQMSISTDGKAYVVWQDTLTAGSKPNILFQGRIDTLLPTITLSVSNTSPKWDDTVTAFGNIGNVVETGTTVKVYWGDGTSTSGIPVSGTSWGPVNHTYTSSAIATNPNQVVARVVSGQFETISSLAVDVNVQKHSTAITLNPIPSVQAGSTVTVTGFFVDLDKGGQGISGQEIRFNGTGADGILAEPVITTSPDGAFSSSGTAPNTVNSWRVTATFEPADSNNPYRSSMSATRAYSTVPADAIRFDVFEANPTVGLAHPNLSFNSSIKFEDITADGSVFVRECSTPSSRRYVSPSPLNMCLEIFPAVQLVSGTSANVTMSFAGKTWPNQYSVSDIDIFHDNTLLNRIIDVTASRNATSVTGTVSDFSKLFAGFALHSVKPQGAHRQQIFVGDGSIISLRDVSNSSAGSVFATFDKSNYTLDDKPILSLSDAEANADPDELETIFAGVISNSSAVDRLFIVITLNETGLNTGVFSGTFSLSDSATFDHNDTLEVGPGDALDIMYLPGPRLVATFDGVTESGVVEMDDLVVNTDCFRPVVGALSLDMIDARLASNGNITLTVSYGNAQLLEEDNPQLLQIFQKKAGTWTDNNGKGLASTVDTVKKTVTAKTSGEGPFSLGFETGCGGGAGGGLGRPGRGIVVDFVVAIVAKPPPPSDSGGTGGGSEGTGGGTGGTGGTGGGTGGTSGTGADITTFPPSYFVLKPLAKIRLMETAFLTAQGSGITEAQAGQQVSITSSFKNFQQQSQKYAYIVVIIDQDGYTVDISSQEGIIGSSQTLQLSSSWLPEAAGKYKFRIFIWDQITGIPIPLSDATERNIRVVEN